MTDPTDSAAQELGRLIRDAHESSDARNIVEEYRDLARAVLDSPAFHAAVQAEVERRVGAVRTLAEKWASTTAGERGWVLSSDQAASDVTAALEYRGMPRQTCAKCRELVAWTDLEQDLCPSCLDADGAGR